MTALESNVQPLWEPSAERVAAANMTRFRRYVEDRWDSCLPDYQSLYQWSIECPEQFWPSVWSFCGVLSGRTWESVLINREKMPGAKWFVGARLNFAENLLRWRDDREALVSWNEAGRQRSVTYRKLYRDVAQLAASLRAAGVTAGDRVVGYLPNIPEAVIATLATTSIGATWSSCSPDFGLQGVVDRFGQIEPKILFAADGYHYNGRPFKLLERVEQIAGRIPSIEKVIVVPYLQSEDRVEKVSGTTPFTAMLDETAEEIDFAQLPFDHPLYILYSSGTTGPPKCIVHGAGGTLIQHLKELVLHTDLKRDDRIIYFTTCGWMMWNWLVSSLAVGATVLLYDGSPLFREGSVLLELAARERTTIFGTSAKYLSAIEKAGLEPGRRYDLGALRTILSTGSPLLSQSYDFVYEKVKRDVCLSSISGGTDIVSCFALGNPIGPVYRGQLQTRGLGMRVEIYDEQARPVYGEKGELVCTAPFPSMPIGFWNDLDGLLYRRSYFEHFSGVWRHGDYAELTDQGGMVIYGRSDTVLNPGGVRIGTAELYRQVERLPEVLESLAVGQQWQADVRVVLFVKLRPGLTLDESLVQRIKEEVRRGTTPRHVPAKVIQVADTPRTLSGKIVEKAVYDVIHGRTVKNTEALANPEALDCFRDLAELES